MTRVVPEWIADHDDQAIPKRVKLRIWEREGGRCHISKRRIGVGEAYQFEHIIALSCGGEHRENNIALALTEPHKEKTKADVAIKAKIARQRAKHLGIKPKKPGGFRGHRKFNGEIVWKDR